MTALEARKAIQELLHVAEDGIIGKNTLAALTLLSGLPDYAAWPEDHLDISKHSGKGSSFADPADVLAFRRCKNQGNSDSFCFKYGDNGVGKWGDDCTEGSGPAVALPPEDWQPYGASARKRKVLVSLPDGSRSVVAELRDTLPHKANITNGAIIDMNPDTCAALGLMPPVMVDVVWSWA